MFDKNNDGFIDLVELRKVRAIEFITILRLSVAQKKSDGILAKNTDYYQMSPHCKNVVILAKKSSFHPWLIFVYLHFTYDELSGPLQKWQTKETMHCLFCLPLL